MFIDGVNKSTFRDKRQHVYGRPLPVEAGGSSLTFFTVVESDKVTFLALATLG